MKNPILTQLPLGLCLIALGACKTSLSSQLDNAQASRLKVATFNIAYNFRDFGKTDTNKNLISQSQAHVFTLQEASNAFSGQSIAPSGYQVSKAGNAGDNSILHKGVTVTNVETIINGIPQDQLDKNLKRSVVKAVINPGPNSVTLFNTHLAHDKDSKPAGGQNRIARAEKPHEKVANIILNSGGRDKRVIITCDCNEYTLKGFDNVLLSNGFKVAVKNTDFGKIYYKGFPTPQSGIGSGNGIPGEPHKVVWAEFNLPGGSGQIVQGSDETVAEAPNTRSLPPTQSQGTCLQHVLEDMKRTGHQDWWYDGSANNQAYRNCVDQFKAEQSGGGVSPAPSCQPDVLQRMLNTGHQDWWYDGSVNNQAYRNCVDSYHDALSKTQAGICRSDVLQQMLQSGHQDWWYDGTPQNKPFKDCIDEFWKAQS